MVRPYTFSIMVLLALGLLNTVGAMPFNSMPIILGSLSDSFSLEASQMGLVGSSTFVGYLLGALLSLAWIERLSWRIAAMVAVLLTAGGYSLTTLVPESLLYPTWAVIGFGASSLACLAIRITAEFKNKEQAFGYRTGIELVVTSILLLILPPLIIANWQYNGAALFIAAVALLLGASALLIPPHGNVEHDEQAKQQYSYGPALIALIVVFIFFMGESGLWAFLERVGKDKAVEPTQMGLIFGLLKVVGAVTALASGWIGDRFGIYFSHIVTFVTIFLGMALLAFSDGFITYALGAWLWEVGYTVGFVYLCATVAVLDRSKRIVVLIPIALALGGILGPGIAGFLKESGGYEAIYVMAIICALIPLLVYSLGLGRIQRAV